ncbi:hypothetical protein [Micromonospora sp. CB01531]|uniref:hypothetical protein n=1 Tax=Micromonospora sp. CB01531 TaxID=1718947 RepID=UPI00093D20CA|nr:hypothetical protein [Micromonospora sp. CB01531]OKI65550.1 hypothetical protein A6A27_24550 [Micromonospora sp. CB01531]
MLHTTITLHLAARTSGTCRVTEVLQQAVALPALIALANDDPLVAAIDAVYNAAIAHGDDRDRFLTDAHTAQRRTADPTSEVKGGTSRITNACAAESTNAPTERMTEPLPRALMPMSVRALTVLLSMHWPYGTDVT